MSSTVQLPKLGVQAVLDDSEFQRRVSRMLNNIKQIEDKVDDLADKSSRADSRRASSARQADRSIGQSLRSLRWEMVTMLFFLRLAERTWRAAWQSMEESTEAAAERMGIRALARTVEVDLGTTSEAIKELADDTMTARDANKVVLQGMLIDQGQFSTEYARLWEAARVAAVVGLTDADAAFEAFLKDLVEGTGAMTDAISPIYGVQQALESYAAQTGRNVDELGQLEAAHIALQQIYGKTNDLVANGADIALEARQAWDQVQASLETFKQVLTGLVTESGALTVFNDLLQAATQSVILLAAGWEAASEAQTAITRRPGEMWRQWMAAAAGEPTEEFTEAFQRYAEPLGLFQRDEVRPELMDYEAMRAAAEKKEEEDYTPLVDQLNRRERLMEDYYYRQEAIQRRYEDRVERTEKSYQESVDRARRNAERDRNAAIRRFQRQQERQLSGHYDRMRRLQEEYHLRLAQNAREYRLREEQSEALYQYERSVLVAEGDVLAIEDLDARHQLEVRAREDNFREQQRQERENFELRRKYMQEQLEETVRDLRRALDDQLEEIRIREEERLAEAAERRQEELEAAELARVQQLEEEQRQHDRSLLQWNQYWVKLADRFDLGLTDVKAIMNQFLGTGGEVSGIMDRFVGDWQGYMTKLQQMQELMNAMRRGASLPFVPGGMSQGAPSGGKTGWPWQYGGDMIVSSPTRFLAGEGGTPEMVSVRPLSNVANVRLSWGGGPIPVQGSGLGGADMTGVGDSIAQGILMQLQKALIRNGATYG